MRHACPVDMLMKTIPYDCLKNPAQSLEVVDSNNAPLCIMAKEDVLRQCLPHRAVALLVRDRRGRALLTLGEQGWGFSSYGQVAAGMSCESSAQDILFHEWSQEGGRLACLGLMPPSASTGLSFLHLYTASLTHSIIKARAMARDRHLLVDQDEMKGLGAHFGDLLSPVMYAALEGGYLSHF